MIEGEGCFYCKESNSRIKSVYYSYRLVGFALMSTDKDVMEKLSILLDLKLNGPYYKNKKRKVVWSVQCTGYKTEVIMQRFYPFLGERRKVQIDSAIEWKSDEKFRLKAS